MNKIESANQLNTFLGGMIRYAGLKLKYRITVDPPLSENRDWERPEILVEFAGPDLLKVGSGQVFGPQVVPQVIEGLRRRQLAEAYGAALARGVPCAACAPAVADRGGPRLPDGGAQGAADLEARRPDTS